MLSGRLPLCLLARSCHRERCHCKSQMVESEAYVVGDFTRRLVARTLAQQFGAAFDAACQPYKFALSTRAGTWMRRGCNRPTSRSCRAYEFLVAMHTLVRDLNVGSVPGDDRRIEVIANGLPLWGGMQLAVDTTLVSALSSTGAPRRYQNRAEGAALRQARWAKERTYPELLRPDSRCRLVVLALEVGGRFSPETVDFVQRLVRARARSVPSRARGAVSAAFARRWSSFLASGASRACCRPLGLARPLGRRCRWAAALGQ